MSCLCFIPSFLLALIATAAFAAPQKITEVEGVSEYRLANGLQVLLAPDPAKPTVTVNVTYRVGSRHENYGETGMAHLLEHLLFKGSKAFPNIPQEQSRRGARVNGTTSYDRTNYYETLAASDDNLQWALRLEADRMVNAFVSRKDLDSEMTVVRNEMERNENNPARILYEKTIAAAYQWHNYGKVTMGARSDVENVPIERLQAFYRQYYQPDNATLIVSGRFDPAQTLSWIEREFGIIPKPQRLLPRFYTVEPPQDGERTVTLERVANTRILTVLYHAPAAAHPDHAALRVLANVLADTPNGRLYQALVKAGKATSVNGGSWGLHDAGTVNFGASLRKEDDPQAARALLLSTVEGTGRQPVTADEVAQAKQTLLTSMEKTFNDPERLGLALSNSVAQGDWRLLFWLRDAIERVSAADANRVARLYLKPSNRTVGEFRPVDQPDVAQIPATPDLNTLLQGYAGRARSSMGEAFDPDPARLDARTERLRLANGLQVALLPKKNRGETVQIALRLRVGTEQSLRKQALTAEMTAAMLMRGTLQRNRESLSAELDRLQTRIGVGGSGQYVQLNAETVRSQLPAVMALMREILREPAFPQAEFQQLTQQYLGYLEANRSQPDSISYLAFSRHLFPYAPDDIRYIANSDESEARIKAVQLEDLRTFHRDFYGTQDALFSAVGDFDATALGQLVTTHFGDWRARETYTRIADSHQTILAQTRILETPGKANAVFRAGLRLPVGENHADYPALRMVSYLLGGGFINSRLATRLRQQEGLSYSVSASLGVSSIENSGSLMVYAIYAPQYRERLAQAFEEEIRRIGRDGFTEQELADGKMAFQQSAQMRRAQDASLAGALVNQLELGQSFAHDAKFETQIAALSLAQVNAVARRYLAIDRFTQVFAGDFATPKQP